MKKQINFGIIFMILNFFIFNILKINNLSLLHGVYIKNIPFYIILIFNLRIALNTLITISVL